MEGLLQAHDSIAILTDRTANMARSTTPSMQTILAKNALTSANNLKNDMKGYSSSTEDIKKVG
jgi:hypothetical protein